jgi:hypothetical protein
MKLKIYCTKIFLAASMSAIIVSCGPAGGKEEGHSNFPKIENDNYYKDHETSPSTHPAYTREDDTVKIESKERGTKEERNK